MKSMTNPYKASCTQKRRIEEVCRNLVEKWRKKQTKERVKEDNSPSAQRMAKQINQRTGLKKTLKMLSILPCAKWIEAKRIKVIQSTKS